MHTDAKRFYAALGVDPAASDEAIRWAFRHRAKELHPDAPSGDANAFILLKQAYDVLGDPDRRADYDRACIRTAAPAPYRFTAPPPMPSAVPPRRTRRAGGIGLARYAVAFLVMAAISLGGVQAMISLTEAPPSIQTRATPRADTTPPAPEPASAPAAEAPAAPGSSKSGFWDATPSAPPRKN